MLVFLPFNSHFFHFLHDLRSLAKQGWKVVRRSSPSLFQTASCVAVEMCRHLVVTDEHRAASGTPESAFQMLETDAWKLLPTDSCSSNPSSLSHA